jgi:hypothetical protein
VLYLSDIKGVMQDLVGEESLDGHFFYQFQEQKDKRGVRVCGEGNGSLSFQAAAAAIGPGKVLLSLVLYLDGTYCLNNIEARVLYSKSTSNSDYISFPSLSMSDSELFLMTVTSRHIALSMSIPLPIEFWAFYPSYLKLPIVESLTTGSTKDDANFCTPVSEK